MVTIQRMIRLITMLDQSITALLLLSLGFGILHAFDADHVVAVSSLSSRKYSWREGFGFATQWAFGHGGILMLVAILALSLHWQLPAIVAVMAEKVIGIVLIVAGGSIVWGFHKQRLRLNIHRHGDHVHAHLTASTATKNEHNHTPVLVGVVHGLAGSAPALALIPVTLQSSWLGMTYILLFSFGVLLGMASFGLLLAYSQRFLLNYSSRLFDACRLLLAAMASGLGVIWFNGGV